MNRLQENSEQEADHDKHKSFFITAAGGSGKSPTYFF